MRYIFFKMLVNIIYNDKILEREELSLVTYIFDHYMTNKREFCKMIDKNLTMEAYFNMINDSSIIKIPYHFINILDTKYYRTTILFDEKNLVLDVQAFVNKLSELLKEV